MHRACVLMAVDGDWLAKKCPKLASSDEKSLGHPCDGMVEASVNAAPWCYGFHVKMSALHCEGYGLDDWHIGLVGTVLRPDVATLQDWVERVVIAIEEGWDFDGGWSPARSLEASWGVDKPLFHRAEFTEDVFDLFIDMNTQYADVQTGFMNIGSVMQPAMTLPRLRYKLMKEWCDDHWKFMNMCWERCSEDFKPCHTETRANAMSRQMMIDFIQSENAEHERAKASANEWWLTYESLLTPPPWKTITEQQSWNQPPADAEAASWGGVG